MLCKLEEKGSRLWRCSATVARCGISRRWGPSYLRNQQRRRFAKFARHHAGLESHLQLENKAATTESPPPHPAEKPDKPEYPDAESSSSPALPPVVSNIAG